MRRALLFLALSAACASVGDNRPRPATRPVTRPAARPLTRPRVIDNAICLAANSAATVDRCGVVRKFFMLALVMLIALKPPRF